MVVVQIVYISPTSLAMGNIYLCLSPNWHQSIINIFIHHKQDINIEIQHKLLLKMHIFNFQEGAVKSIIYDFDAILTWGKKPWSFIIHSDPKIN